MNWHLSSDSDQQAEDEILNNFKEFFKQNERHTKEAKHGSDTLQDAEANAH